MTAADNIDQMMAEMREHVQNGYVDPASCTRVIDALRNSDDLPYRGYRAEAYNYLGSWQAENSQIGAAVDSMAQSIAAYPDNVEFRLNLVVILRRLGWIAKAIDQGKQCVKMAPHYARCHLVLGTAATDAHDYELAQKCFEKVVEMNPDDIEGLINLASVLSDNNQTERALKMYNRALKVQPNNVSALQGIATIAARKLDFKTAWKYYDKAQAIEPDHAMTRWNVSQILLTEGRYEEAWPYFAERLRQQNGNGKLHAVRFNRPILAPGCGAKPGDRVLIQHEMGHGDVLQFSRYAPMLAERGYDVRFEVFDGMVDLMRRSFPSVTILPEAVDWPGVIGLGEFEYHIPLMSLPGYFNTKVETIPWNGPYLVPDPKKVAAWQARLASLPGKKIGLCWAGLRREESWCTQLDMQRSIAYRELYEGIQNLDCSFISLQLGKPRDEGFAPLYDFTDDLKTWDDTAALISALDLVITVDTSVVHLAGALGKPVWMLNRYATCWRWMMEREDTPWYSDSFRIYRQAKPYDWSDVLARVSGDLNAFCRPHVAEVRDAAQ